MFCIVDGRSCDEVFRSVCVSVHTHFVAVISSSLKLYSFLFPLFSFYLFLTLEDVLFSAQSIEN